jgi:hypothetical protein
MHFAVWPDFFRLTITQVFGIRISMGISRPRMPRFVVLAISKGRGPYERDDHQNKTYEARGF